MMGPSRIGLRAALAAALLAGHLCNAQSREYTLPDPLRTSTGKRMTAEEWRSRGRGEVLELFRTHVYGRSPKPESVRFKVAEEDPRALDGKATRREVDIEVRGAGGGHTPPPATFLPHNTPQPLPLFPFFPHRRT
ncbi:MAG: hypothetical protein ACK5AZ_16580, partial [Bryobacteraceae bacterium]